MPVYRCKSAGQAQGFACHRSCCNPIPSILSLPSLSFLGNSSSFDFSRLSSLSNSRIREFCDTFNERRRQECDESARVIDPSRWNVGWKDDPPSDDRPRFYLAASQILIGHGIYLYRTYALWVAPTVAHVTKVTRGIPFASPSCLARLLAPLADGMGATGHSARRRLFFTQRTSRIFKIRAREKSIA